MQTDVVTIATFQSLPEAEACRLGLESEGITVLLTDAETIRTDWLLSNAIGSIKVQVRAADVEAATRLITEIQQRHEAQSRHPEKDYCLSCGVEMPEDAIDCPACGWSYGTTDEEKDDRTDDE